MTVMRTFESKINNARNKKDNYSIQQNNNQYKSFNIEAKLIKDCYCAGNDIYIPYISSTIIHPEIHQYPGALF